MQATFQSYHNNLRVSPCSSHLSKPFLGRRGDTAGAGEKSHPDVLPAEGLDALGLSGSGRAGSGPGTGAAGDTSLLGQGLSAPGEISLMRHISCPQHWPLSPECHISVTGSC